MQFPQTHEFPTFEQTSKFADIPNGIYLIQTTKTIKGKFGAYLHTLKMNASEMMSLKKAPPVSFNTMAKEPTPTTLTNFFGFYVIIKK